MDYDRATLAGLPRQLLDILLLYVINAAVRLVFSVRKYVNITPLLRDFHLSRVHISRCNSVEYPTSNPDGGFDLRHMTSLIVPRTHHQPIHDRAFPGAAAHVWNSLSPTVAMSPSLSLSASKQNLETQHFTRSYLHQDE